MKFKKLIFSCFIFIIITMLLFSNVFAANSSYSIKMYVCSSWKDADSGQKTDEAIYKNENATELQETQVTDGRVANSTQGNFDARNTKTGFCVRYNWLRGVKNICTQVQGASFYGFKDSKDVIKKAIDGLNNARKNLGSFVGKNTEITKDKVSMDWVLWTPFGLAWENDSTSRESLAWPIRSITAYNNIVPSQYKLPDFDSKKYKSDENLREQVNKQFTAYEKNIYSNIQTLRAAYDYKSGTGSYKFGNININDGYKAKFTYDKTNILRYDFYYSMENLTDNLDGNGKISISSSEANVLKRCWGAKAAAEAAGYPNVATDTSIYVRKKDDKNTKMNYSKDKIWLYIQIFTPSKSDFLGDNMKMGTTDFGEIVVKWANTLKGTNEFTTANADSIGKAYIYLKSIPNYVSAGQKAIKESSEAAEDLTSTVVPDADSGTDAVNEDEAAKIDPDIGTTFYMANNLTSESKSGPSDLVNDAESFVDGSDSENYLKTENLQDFSQKLYSILLGIGIVLSVIIGIILGIKFMLASVAEKAQVKKLLVTYAIGCAVVFGAFGIWKLVVTIMQNI